MDARIGAGPEIDTHATVPMRIGHEVIRCGRLPSGA
jgi:hypothetical protein